MQSISPHGSLRWAVLESFLRYVTVIARGSVSVDGVETDDEGRFVFPLRAMVRKDDEWHLSFGGSVRFTAHQGFLDVLIAAPEVIIGSASGGLATHTTDEDAPLRHLVEFGPVKPETRNGIVWQSVPTRLVSSAEQHFGDVYTAGHEMAPLSITLEPLDS